MTSKREAVNAALSKFENYKVPDVIPFPHKNTNRWNKIVDAMKSEIKTFEDFSVIFKGFITKMDVWKVFESHQMSSEEKKLFYEKTIPFLQSLVLKTEELFPEDIPMLLHFKESEICLTREQCACIIANSFFGTFERLSFEQLWSYYELPSINLDDLFDGKDNLQPKLAKIKMFLNYFDRIMKSMPKGKVSFKRKVQPLPETRQNPINLSKSDKILKMATIMIKGGIEDCHDGLQADFANAFIGGACISYGCVQEEILFSTNPECMVSRLFTPVMYDNEAVVIKGAEKFSSYKGYGFSLEYGGNFEDPNVDENGFNKNHTVAMDARIYSGRKQKQWEKVEIEREILKSYVAFSNNDLKKVATGNWGCGAFDGDRQLKLMIQWISTCELEQEMVYYTFNDAKLASEISEIMKYLVGKNTTVGILCSELFNYKSKNNGENLFVYLKASL